jgi:hypothetical protein
MNGRISILLKKNGQQHLGELYDQRNGAEITGGDQISGNGVYRRDGDFFYYSFNFKPILGWVLPLGRMNG